MSNTQQVGWWSKMTNVVNSAVSAEQTVGVVPPLKKGGEGGFKDSYQTAGHCKDLVDCLAQKIISSNWLPFSALAGAVKRNKLVNEGNRVITSDTIYYGAVQRREPKSPEEMVAEAFKLLERVSGGEPPDPRKIITANRDAFKLFGWAAREYNEREEFVEAAEAFGWQGDSLAKVGADKLFFTGIYSNEARAWARAIDAVKDQRRRAYLTQRYGNALIKTGRFDEGNAEIDSAVAYYEGTARNAKLRRLANQIISKIRSYQATLLLERSQFELAAVNFERAAEATDGRQKAEMVKRAILLKNAGDAWIEAGMTESPLYGEIKQLRSDAADRMLAKVYEVTDPPGTGPVVGKKRPPKESGPDVPGAGKGGKLDRKLLQRAAEGNSDALRRLVEKTGRDFIEKLASRDRALLGELKGSGLRRADIDRLVRNAGELEGAASAGGVTDGRRRKDLIERRGK